MKQKIILVSTTLVLFFGIYANVSIIKNRVETTTRSALTLNYKNKAYADDTECDLCKIVKNGNIIFSCTEDPLYSCSKSYLGYTLSCNEAKECEN